MAKMSKAEALREIDMAIMEARPAMMEGANLERANLERANIPMGNLDGANRRRR